MKALRSKAAIALLVLLSASVAHSSEIDTEKTDQGVDGDEDLLGATATPTPAVSLQKWKQQYTGTSGSNTPCWAYDEANKQSIQVTGNPGGATAPSNFVIEANDGGTGAGKWNINGATFQQIPSTCGYLLGMFLLNTPSNDQALVYCSSVFFIISRINGSILVNMPVPLNNNLVKSETRGTQAAALEDGGLAVVPSVRGVAVLGAGTNNQGLLNIVTCSGTTTCLGSLTGSMYYACCNGMESVVSAFNGPDTLTPVWSLPTPIATPTLHPAVTPVGKYAAVHCVGFLFPLSATQPTETNITVLDALTGQLVWTGGQPVGPVTMAQLLAPHGNNCKDLAPGVVYSVLGATAASSSLIGACGSVDHANSAHPLWPSFTNQNWQTGAHFLALQPMPAPSPALILLSGVDRLLAVSGQTGKLMWSITAESNFFQGAPLGGFVWPTNSSVAVVYGLAGTSASWDTPQPLYSFVVETGVVLTTVAPPAEYLIGAAAVDAYSFVYNSFLPSSSVTTAAVFLSTNISAQVSTGTSSITTGAYGEIVNSVGYVHVSDGIFGYDLANGGKEVVVAPSHIPSQMGLEGKMYRFQNYGIYVKDSVTIVVIDLYNYGDVVTELGIPSSCGPLEVVPTIGRLSVHPTEGVFFTAGTRCLYHITKTLMLETLDLGQAGESVGPSPPPSIQLHPPTGAMTFKITVAGPSSFTVVTYSPRAEAMSVKWATSIADQAVTSETLFCGDVGMIFANQRILAIDLTANKLAYLWDVTLLWAGKSGYEPSALCSFVNNENLVCVNNTNQIMSSFVGYTVPQGQKRVSWSVNPAIGTIYALQLAKATRQIGTVKIIATGSKGIVALDGQTGTQLWIKVFPDGGCTAELVVHTTTDTVSARCGVHDRLTVLSSSTGNQFFELLTAGHQLEHILATGFYTDSQFMIVGTSSLLMVDLPAGLDVKQTIPFVTSPPATLPAGHTDIPRDTNFTGQFDIRGHINNGELLSTWRVDGLAGITAANHQIVSKDKTIIFFAPRSEAVGSGEPAYGAVNLTDGSIIWSHQVPGGSVIPQGVPLGVMDVKGVPQGVLVIACGGLQQIPISLVAVYAINGTIIDQQTYPASNAGTFQVLFSNPGADGVMVVTLHQLQIQVFNPSTSTFLHSAPKANLNLDAPVHTVAWADTLSIDFAIITMANTFKIYTTFLYQYGFTTPMPIDRSAPSLATRFGWCFFTPKTFVPGGQFFTCGNRDRKLFLNYTGLPQTSTFSGLTVTESSRYITLDRRQYMLFAVDSSFNVYAFLWDQLATTQTFTAPTWKSTITGAPSNPSMIDIGVAALQDLVLVAYTKGTNDGDLVALNFTDSGAQVWSLSYQNPSSYDNGGLSLSRNATSPMPCHASYDCLDGYMFTIGSTFGYIGFPGSNRSQAPFGLTLPQTIGKSFYSHKGLSHLEGGDFDNAIVTYIGLPQLSLGGFAESLIFVHPNPDPTQVPYAYSLKDCKQFTTKPGDTSLIYASCDPYWLVAFHPLNGTVAWVGPGSSKKVQNVKYLGAFPPLGGKEVIAVQSEYNFLFYDALDGNFLSATPSLTTACQTAVPWSVADVKAFYYASQFIIISKQCVFVLRAGAPGTGFNTQLHGGNIIDDTDVRATINVQAMQDTHEWNLLGFVSEYIESGTQYMMLALTDSSNRYYLINLLNDPLQPKYVDRIEGTGGYAITARVYSNMFYLSAGDVVMALNATSGRVEWRQTLPTGPKHVYTNVPFSWYSDRLYLAVDAHIYVVNANIVDIATTRVQADLMATTQLAASYNMWYESGWYTLISQNRAILPGRVGLVALDIATSTLLWQQWTPYHWGCLPMVAQGATGVPGVLYARCTAMEPDSSTTRTYIRAFSMSDGRYLFSLRGSESANVAVQVDPEATLQSFFTQNKKGDFVYQLLPQLQGVPLGSFSPVQPAQYQTLPPGWARPTSVPHTNVPNGENITRGDLHMQPAAPLTVFSAPVDPQAELHYVYYGKFVVAVGTTNVKVYIVPDHYVRATRSGTAGLGSNSEYFNMVFDLPYSRFGVAPGAQQSSFQPFAFNSTHIGIWAIGAKINLMVIRPFDLASTNTSEIVAERTVVSAAETGTGAVITSLPVVDYLQHHSCIMWTSTLNGVTKDSFICIDNDVFGYPCTWTGTPQARSLKYSSGTAKYDRLTIVRGAKQTPLENTKTNLLVLDPMDQALILVDLATGATLKTVSTSADVPFGTAPCEPTRGMTYFGEADSSCTLAICTTNPAKNGFNISTFAITDSNIFFIDSVEMGTTADGSTLLDVALTTNTGGQSLTSVLYQDQNKNFYLKTYVVELIPTAHMNLITTWNPPCYPNCHGLKGLVSSFIIIAPCDAGGACPCVPVALVAYSVTAPQGTLGIAVSNTMLIEIRIADQSVGGPSSANVTLGDHISMAPSAGATIAGANLEVNVLLNSNTQASELAVYGVRYNMCDRDKSFGAFSKSVQVLPSLGNLHTSVLARRELPLMLGGVCVPLVQAGAVSSVDCVSLQAGGWRIENPPRVLTIAPDLGLIFGVHAPSQGSTTTFTQVYAISAATGASAGSLFWAKNFSHPVIGSFYKNCTSAGQSVLYIVTVNTLYVLDAHTGAELHYSDLPPIFHAPSSENPDAPQVWFSEVMWAVGANYCQGTTTLNLATTNVVVIHELYHPQGLSHSTFDPLWVQLRTVAAPGKIILSKHYFVCASLYGDIYLYIHYGSPPAEEWVRHPQPQDASGYSDLQQPTGVILGSFVYIIEGQMAKAMSLLDGQVGWYQPLGAESSSLHVAGQLLIVATTSGFLAGLHIDVPGSNPTTTTAAMSSEVQTSAPWSPLAWGEKAGTVSPSCNGGPSNSQAIVSGDIALYVGNCVLAAYDAATGTSLYSLQLGDTNPTKIMARDGILYLVAQDQPLMAVVIQTGQLLGQMGMGSFQDSSLNIFDSGAVVVEEVSQRIELLNFDQVLGRNSIPQPPAAAAVVVPTGTLPPGYVAPGAFTGVPALQGSLTKPPLGCVLVMEKVVQPFLICVQGATTSAYSTQAKVNDVGCTSLGTALNVCAADYLAATTDARQSCPVILTYLNQMLTAFGKSQPLNMCEASKAHKCTSGESNQGICDFVKTATNLGVAGDAALPDSVLWPNALTTANLDIFLTYPQGVTGNPTPAPPITPVPTVTPVPPPTPYPTPVPNTLPPTPVPPTPVGFTTPVPTPLPTGTNAPTSVPAHTSATGSGSHNGRHTNAPTQSNQPSAPKKSNAGAIAGALVAVFVGIGVTAGAVFVVMKRKNAVADGANDGLMGRGSTNLDDTPNAKSDQELLSTRGSSSGIGGNIQGGYGGL